MPLERTGRCAKWVLVANAAPLGGAREPSEDGPQWRRWEFERNVLAEFVVDTVEPSALYPPV